MSDRTARRATERPPTLALWLNEATALVGLGAYAATLPWWRLAPCGDGHPVLVVPGLMQSDRSTLPLRAFLKNRGYDVHAWALGMNTGRPRLVDDHLLPRLRQLHARSGRPVSIVGWSMGGLFARELAKRAPEVVRQVITLGSPFTGDAKASNAWRLYQWMSGQRAGDPAIAQRFAGPLPVPTSAIYSRIDGIVAWRCCINDTETPAPGLAAPAENIEVRSTHLGLGHHPAVLWALADRLAQAEGTWAPFEPPAGLRWMYPPRKTAPNTHKAKETHHDPGPTSRPLRPRGPGHWRLARPGAADGRGAG